MALNTTVFTPALLSGAADVGANAGVLGGAIGAGAVTAAAAVPAGVDDASLLASANVASHTANLLGVMGHSLFQDGELALFLGTAAARYDAEELANATMFPIYGPPV